MVFFSGPLGAALLLEAGGEMRYGTLVTRVRAAGTAPSDRQERERRGRAVLDLIGRLGAEGKVQRAGPNGCLLRLRGDALADPTLEPTL